MKQWLAKIPFNRLDKLAPLVFFVLLAWLCWRLANIFWWFVAPPQAPTVQSVALGSQQVMVPNIVRVSLFDEPQQNIAAAGDMNLKLEGVVVASPRHLSSAVIRMNDKADSYTIGDKIADSDIELAEVYWDHVILKRAGQNMTLKFGQTDNVNALINPTSTATDNPSSSPLGQAIEQMQQNREQYLGQMGVSQSDGFQITDKTPAGLRNALGLQPGDKILSINGQTVTQGNELQLLQQVQTTGQAKIEIQRGSQTMTIQQSF